MLARNYFGVGFLRGLNSVSEVFAPYHPERERSLPGEMRSEGSRLREDAGPVMGAALANSSEDVSGHPPAESRIPPPPTTSIISAHWSGPLPPAAELERIDRIIPGGAERLLCMAEKSLENELCAAEKKLENEGKEQTHRAEDTKRGQYFGWSLAMGAVITATVVSLCHGLWEVSVALVGIPVAGAVQALIQGRKEK